MPATSRYPQSASVYEAVRNHPGAAARLAQVGIRPEHYDYRLADAASEFGVSVQRLEDLIDRDPSRN